MATHGYNERFDQYTMNTYDKVFLTIFGLLLPLAFSKLIRLVSAPTPDALDIGLAILAVVLGVWLTFRIINKYLY